MAQVVSACLPSKRKALSSNPSTAKNNTFTKFVLKPFGGME
jgi:hypothetical protein